MGAGYYRREKRLRKRNSIPWLYRYFPPGSRSSLKAMFASKGLKAMDVGYAKMAPAWPELDRVGLERTHLGHNP